MPLRSSRFSKLTFYIIISSLILLFSFFIFLTIIYFYPIPTVTNNFNNAQHSQFLSPWPMSALEQEILERRRLKRYARGEQIRRMEKQLHRMELLNIPIYDLFLDDNAEISVNRFTSTPEHSAFLWPMLPGNKLFSNFLNPTSYRKTASIIFPLNHWSQINEGVLLLGGDELKATIPIVKGRRVFSFTIFLVSPGSLRVNLGQYVWAKTFSEDDVQKRHRFSIPINDSTATAIKIVSVSSSFYLLNGNVNNIESSGRSPIRISENSNFWSANKELLVSNQKKAEEDDESKEQEAAELEKQLEDSRPEEAKLEELIDEQNAVTPKKKEVKKLEAIKDPLTQIANQQILTNDLYTTAFGYNILFLQLPEINENIIANAKAFKKAAPNLAQIYGQSHIFNKSIHINNSASENFRKFIYSDHNFIFSDNIPIVKEEINDNKHRNTYYQLRKYGYNIVGISYPQAFYYNQGISETTNFSKIYGKWLEKNDWNYANKNLKIDDRNIPVSGLEAIFKTTVKGISPPLSSQDYSVVSSFLRKTAQNIDRIPDWGANEYILINNKELYLPRVIEAFQNWTKENQQTRFLAHLLLDSEYTPLRPSIKELGKSIATIGFSSLLNPARVSEIADTVLLDKAVGQILDTLKARKIENRTIVFILIPNKNKTQSATGILKIPGLIPKNNSTFKTVYITDIVATVLTNVGIPLENTNANITEDKQGIILENLTDKDYITLKNSQISQKNNYTKYSMVIKPDENNCSSFIWNSLQEPIFDIQANYPIYQIISSNQIEIFPCAIKKKFVQLYWYQKRNLEFANNDNIENYLAGNFQFKKDQYILPEFYFGKKLIPINNISFYFNSLSKDDAKSIFVVEDKNLKQCISTYQKNFEAIEIFESKNVEDQILSKKTKVGFTMTPL